ncbi:hypothetical protein [Gynurincola endophyticus]|uniref:hypothetical protein n=1 Tax=Gynurincola endophyticus TaxID=2479004 RepID=UPI000F8C4767|nr:hypothetical protein [Gynurincola endophyticus]
MSDYTYELCRISSDSHLEYIIVHIPKKDRWIQIYLNVFQLSPTLTDIRKLNGIDGLNYRLIPNSNTEMRLRADEYKVPPLILILFLPKYKISRSLCSYSSNGKVKKITNLIKGDMANIDFFIKRWHELYKPVITNWEGVRIK